MRIIFSLAVRVDSWITNVSSAKPESKEDNQVTCETTILSLWLKCCEA